MSLPLKAHPKVKDDLKALPTRAHRLNALRMISKLKDQPKLGLPLGYLKSVGDLSSFRKIYFSDSSGRSPDYRIVYRLEPDEETPVIIYIAGVGEREKLKIYREVINRLQGR